ncbi:cytochrome P450 6A1-like [Copidosoma floridanum]|uniref:cytochrome P450 6A1-like n=1 Tax=Copidosoma floridanum TaxID=29053 RepID=UPI0006C982E8|nr:cytochrome P450 6A1-like [Copidosoma floridanum]
MFQFIDTKLMLLSAVLVAIYVYLKFCVYNYWKKYNVPHDNPSIPLGNVPVSYFFGRVHLAKIIKNSYVKFCRYPFHGMYFLHKPVLMINDPDLIQTILIKEFHKFADRGWFTDKRVDPMSANLFFQPYAKWRRLRTKFSPSFSPVKLRQIYPLLEEVSDSMIKACDDLLKKTDVVDVKDLFVRYTVDVISSTVYGFNCNSFENPDNQFRRYGIKALDFGRISMLFIFFIPEVLQSIILPAFGVNIREFFNKIFIESVTHRRKEKIERKDFMSLLMQLMDKGHIEDNDSSLSSDDKIEDVDPLSMEEAAAQAFVFFLGGFETPSAVSTNCLLELAMHPEVQQKLQQEIDTVLEKNPSGLTYDCISEMQYLDMVFNETLRKHPPGAFLNRICLEDFQIPGSDFTIPKGMRLLISLSGLHNDPEHYPNPSRFDPERFTKENVDSRSTCMHIGFGDGPRNCIAKSLGMLKSKQALVALLRNYTFRVCDKTNLPTSCSTESYVQIPEQSVLLSFKKRRE